MNVYENALADCRAQIIELNKEINAAVYEARKLFEWVNNYKGVDVTKEQSTEIANALWWHVCKLEALYQTSKAYSLNAALKCFAGK